MLEECLQYIDEINEGVIKHIHFFSEDIKLV